MNFEGDHLPDSCEDEIHEEFHADEDVRLPILSSFVRNVVTYMAGWICRLVRDSSECEACYDAVSRNANVDHLDDTATDLLIQLRDQGGLLMPSADLVRICLACENVVRVYGTSTFHTFHSRVYQQLGEDVSQLFGDADQPHFLSSNESSHDHILSLVNYVVRMYFLARKFHNVKLQNEASWASRHRFRQTKAILFNGE